MIPLHYDYGVSTASQEIVQYEEKLRHYDSQTISLGWRDLLCHNLLEIQSRCCEYGWDGYDAIPIDRQTLKEGIFFIKLLPDYIEIPEIVPEPTGELGFLWEKTKDVTFVASVSPGTIIFAGLVGHSKNYGELKFLSVLPDLIKKTLFDYFSKP